MIKTPLRYPGGKTRISDELSRVFPGNIKEFREPFLGGGSVFLSFLQNRGEINKFWLNDIYSPLINFWTIATHKKDNEKLTQNILNIHKNGGSGREIFLNTKKMIGSSEMMEQAVAFFVLNRITFSGTIESGGFSQGAFDGRFTLSSIKRVEELKNIEQDKEIVFSNIDYEKLILHPGEDVLIFLDPPYHSAKKSGLYGKNGSNHKFFDFERLAKLLRNTNHKWLMTIDDDPYIRKLFEFAYFKEFNLKYVMGPKTSGSKIGNELLIANFELL